jgi:LmbE family N-acetylglucosaminyl deacetylase
MAVLAHPDDESLGVGGTLAKYASEGVDVFLVTATRGDGGRYRGHHPDDHRHPGPQALANIREQEPRAAASVLGVREPRCSTTATSVSTAPTYATRSRTLSGTRRVRPDRS